ncbi:hypothetical protein CLAIMM_12075 [Cladophialophora immunda]|nr:hypothetical protein CLAIMM_12075 [Cladophialophora immunda]
MVISIKSLPLLAVHSASLVTLTLSGGYMWLYRGPGNRAICIFRRNIQRTLPFSLRSARRKERDPDISFFVATLAEMGENWLVAKRYSKILSRVLEEYRQSQRTSGRQCFHSSASSC